MEKLEIAMQSPSGWDSLSNYMGPTKFPGWYAVLARHRDSDILTRSNWEVAKEMLGKVDNETVSIYEFGHWAVGWIEYLCVHESSSEKMAIAKDIREKIDRYPILSEDRWSQMEWDEIHDYWARCSLSERVDYCRENGESIFAARDKNSIPEKVFDWLRDTWQ